MGSAMTSHRKYTHDCGSTRKSPNSERANESPPHSRRILQEKMWKCMVRYIIVVVCLRSFADGEEVYSGTSLYRKNRRLVGITPYKIVKARPGTPPITSIRCLTSCSKEWECRAYQHCPNLGECQLLSKKLCDSPNYRLDPDPDCSYFDYYSNMKPTYVSLCDSFALIPDKILTKTILISGYSFRYFISLHFISVPFVVLTFML